MKWKFLNVVIAVVLLAAVVSAERGFLLKSPRVLKQNSINKLDLSLYNVTSPGEVTLKLLSRENGTVFAEKTQNIEPVSDTTLEFYVPSIANYEALLRIEGKFDVDGGYSIFGEDVVYFTIPHSMFTFIQTDKPLYKPGQQVKFRVLILDENLKIPKNLYGSVWVEDPDSRVVAQWKNLTFEEGILQLELPLSEEPKYGAWNIFASVNGSDESTSFEVKEYVLPKFEVVITPPSYVLSTAEEIPIKICAKYTYGKLVEGELKINASVETYSWSYDKLPVVQEEKELNGCYEFVLNVSLVDNEYRYHYRRIQIFAQVTEKGTGVTRNETTYIDRTQSPLRLSFQTESAEYFKPGLPYHGQIKVNNPDESPASDEPVSVCMVVSRERIISGWWGTKKTKHCRNYTSGADGLIDFTVPPQNTDAVSLSIEAKSLKYSKKSEPPKPSLYAPQTSTYLRPWYSPSGSHMQIQGIKGDLPCDSKQDIQVLYTAKGNGDFKFYYEVVRNGKVVDKNMIVTEFDESNKVSEDISSTAIDGESIAMLPALDNAESLAEEDMKCKPLAETRYVPHIGSVNISLNVNSALSPSFHLIVYYLRDDREAVADSQKFSVQKCFPNKVSLKFGDESKQPGTKTSLSLEASPNSLCGVKVVDKSVRLLNSNDQLSKDKVFEQLNQYDLGRYYPNNHCDGTKQPGLGKRSSEPWFRPRPPSWSSSSYEDTLTAFETAGFLVISDLILLTRPCKSNSGGYLMDYVPHAAAAEESNFSGGAMALARVSTRMPASAMAAPMPTSQDAERKSFETTKSVVDVRTQFPETWLFDIENVGEDGKLTTKKQLPHTVTEWLGDAFCVNNEDGLGISDTASVKGFQAFFLSFTLPYSVVRGEKLPVVVSIFNYLEKCLPITLELTESEDFTLLSESSKTDICVCGGKSESHRYYIQPKTLGTVNLTVSGKTAEAAGVCGSSEVSDSVARDAITNPLIVEAEGFPYEKVSSYLFCPKDYPDSVFKENIPYNLPEDVVEDSARGFISVSGDIMGPAIKGIDKLVQMPTGCGEQNIVRFAPNVYVLDYLNAIGQVTDQIKNKVMKNLQTGYQRELKYKRTDSSYSAFGNTDREGSLFLTAFVVRAFADASRYIDIDQMELDESRQWILSKQRSNGCFPEVGRTLSASLKGGVQGQNVSTLLTAYVLSSLLSSGVKDKNVTDLAMSCIEAETELTPYKAALFAYTAALAGDQEKAQKYLDELYLTADSDGEKTRWHDKRGHMSVEVEIASYAVLTNVMMGKPLSESLPIVKWLNSNRNSRGGFRSTQDTVLGLEALSKFAPLIGKNPLDISIALTGALEEKVPVTNDDRLLVKEFKLSSVPGEVNVEASGTGCSVIQATLRCNTKTAHVQEHFSLEVKASKESESNCNSININLCTSYLSENKKSNMALVEMKMVSGFLPVRGSLEQLKTNRSIKLKRYEVDNNNLVLYFNELTNEKKCFNFLLERVNEVDEMKPAVVKVYDYYATEKKQETSYEIVGC